MKIPQRGRAAMVRLSGALLLFGLNIHIVWRLLFTEYLPHFVSIEPLFFALARAIRSGTHLGWWQQWFCGMPFAYTYQPLLHYTVAGLSGITGLSVPRAFHVVIAIGYALGPVTVYALALRLSRRVDVSLTAGLLYSFWSPASLLMPEMAASVSGLWYPLRLNSPIVYADSPLVFGLTLLPLAILLLDRALERPTSERWILAGLGIISVLLTNIPAFISLAMALAAYGLAADRGRRLRTWVAMVACSLTGYVLAAIFLPPSGLWLNVSNAQTMDPAGRLSNHLLAYCMVGAGLFLAAYALTRLGAPRFVRFATLFALLTMTVVLSNSWFHVSLLAQAGRFYLAMEMAIVMAISFVVVPLVTKWRAGQIILAIGLAIFTVVQIAHYRWFARIVIKSASITARSEYKIARWMDENAHGARVIVPGSVSFWLNALTGTPQAIGCCEQNALFRAPQAAYWLTCNDPSPELSIAWLRVLGVHYVAMCGPRSMEHYKAIRYPDKFDAVLPLRWRDGDDSIFEVPSRSDSLAHVVTRGDLLQTDEPGLATLQNYVAAMESPVHSIASFTWETRNVARIEGVVRRGELVGVQIPYHFGWRADSAGRQAHISRDGLGLMTIEPDCDGPCSIKLTFTGGVEAVLLRIFMLLGWTAALIAIAVPRLQHRKKT